ncbi:MAG: hypothetical protein V2B18_15285 [Pseudomonadota bacterium]
MNKSFALLGLLVSLAAIIPGAGSAQGLQAPAAPDGVYVQPPPPAGSAPTAPRPPFPVPHDPSQQRGLRPSVPESPGAAQRQQAPFHYALRPELSNPEYCECLKMEKHWKALWQTYTQIYNQAQAMNRADPRYGPTTYQAANIKQQLDAAWYAFSNRCVYFPERK